MKFVAPALLLCLVACASSDGGTGVAPEADTATPADTTTPDTAPPTDTAVPTDTPALTDAQPNPGTDVAETPDPGAIPDDAGPVAEDIAEAVDPGPTPDDVEPVDAGDPPEDTADAGAAPDIGAGSPCPPEGPYGTAEGQTAPDLILKDCDGNDWSLHDLCGEGAWLFGYAHW